MEIVKQYTSFFQYKRIFKMGNGSLNQLLFSENSKKKSVLKIWAEQKCPLSNISYRVREINNGIITHHK